MPSFSLRDQLARRVDAARGRLIAATQRLVAVASPNPPSDTHDVAAVAEALLLEIPGIDTQSALTRTGGNRQRYVSLLRRFADSQVGAVGKMRAVLKAQDSATAQRIAHSLKGAVGNFHAIAAFHVAEKLEHLGKQGSLAPAAEMCGVLERELARLQKTLSELLNRV